MLLRNDRIVLNVIRKSEPKLTNFFYSQEDIWSILQDRNVSITAEETLAAFNNLENEGFITYASNSRTAFRLNSKGQHYGEYRFKMFLNYISEKWIEFFALTVSIISLVLSIIAISA